MQTSTVSNEKSADIVFTSCELREGNAQPPRLAMGSADAGVTPRAAARRREVTVGGKRVKTIDIHCHCVIPETLAIVGRKLENERGPGIGEVGERRLREMDEQGIDIEALSINPYWYEVDRD